MRIFDEQEFRLAGMHFLGFVSENDQVTALKCHYYQGLAEAFGQGQDPRLLRQLEELMAWDDARPRFYCTIMALALDDRDRLTVNFYYRETK